MSAETIGRPSDAEQPEADGYQAPEVEGSQTMESPVTDAILAYEQALVVKLAERIDGSSESNNRVKLTPMYTKYANGTQARDGGMTDPN